jgi:hypothetical protein
MDDNTNLKWNFPTNNGGLIVGIGESGVETFRGTPFKSLAREICQNSLDAHLENDQPTRIEFMPFDLEPDSVPAISDLQDAFRRSIDFWSIQNSNKQATNFFNKALQKSTQKIHCLRISDFNTTGLNGSDVPYNSPWSNLTKSTGISDKGGTNGGSFGIGKFAPFACSDFRTVFYSTIDIDGKAAFQGISRLTSFKTDNEEITQGIGFLGDEKNNPMPMQTSLDPNFTRPEDITGTDLYILAFSLDTEWKDNIIASILDGFLYAIYKGTLVVNVGGTIISSNTLSDLISTYGQNSKENADKYYKVLSSSDEVAPVFENELPNLGKISLKIMIDPGLHRKVAMIRKTGMKIFDRDRISGTIPFAGILYIEGDNLNSYLRNLENPQHTEWQISRAENQQEAKNILNSFFRFIKQSLESLEKKDITEEIDPAVGGYLAFDNSTGDNLPEVQAEAITDLIQDVRVHTITRYPSADNIDSPKQNEGEISDDIDGGITLTDPGSGSGHGSGGKSSGGDGGGNLPGQGEGNDLTTKHKNITNVGILKSRFICTDKSTGNYLISFTPKTSAKNGYLELYQSAESSDYKAPLVNAVCNGEILQIDNNKIMIEEFIANSPLLIYVTLNYHDYCSLEVKAYGYKD